VPAVPQPEEIEQHSEAIRTAQHIVGDRCGFVSGDEAAQQDSLNMLATAMRNQGYCAWRDEDRVLVNRGGLDWSDDWSAQWSVYNAVYYGNGCWRSNGYKGVLEETKIPDPVLFWLPSGVLEEVP